MAPDEQLPQLRMIHRLQSEPEPVILPPGFSVRKAEASDASRLASLLTDRFQDPWDTTRVNLELLANSDVPTTWVVETEGLVVATASYQLMPVTFPESGWVHYVAADNSLSGLGLGYVVAWNVVHQAILSGRNNVRLTTDDFRLPAIRTYQKLGFEPEPWHASHPVRWDAVQVLLAGRMH